MNIVEKIKIMSSLNEKLERIKYKIYNNENSILLNIKNFKLRKILNNFVFFTLSCTSIFLIPSYFIYIVSRIPIFSYDSPLFIIIIIFGIVLGLYLLYLISLLSRKIKIKEYRNNVKGKKSKLFRNIYISLSYYVFQEIRYEDYLAKEVDNFIEKLKEKEKDILLKNYKEIYNSNRWSMEEKLLNNLREKKDITEKETNQIKDYIEENITDKERAYLLIDKIKTNKNIIKNKKVICL